MNKKWIRNWKIYGSVGLAAATIATTASICVSNTNANTNNMLNGASNSAVLASENQAEPVAEPKAAVDSDFLLNSDNAITMSNNITALTSTSTTNGPRGFLAQVENNINYVGYDGKTIWSVAGLFGTQTGAGLISSHYNAFANCFVVLYVGSNYIRIASLSEVGGAVINTDTQFAIPSDVNNYKRYLLVPIYETDNITVKAYYAIRQFIGETKYIGCYPIDSAGTLTYDSSKSGTTDEYNTENDIWLSVGAMNYNGTVYLAATHLYTQGASAGNAYIYTALFKNFSLMSGSAITFDTVLSVDNKWIDTNIPEVHVKFNSADTSIFITAIINADTSKTTIFSAQYNITPNTLTNKITINLEQPTNGKLNYDIYRGRFYGNYLYAYLGTADYNGTYNSRKIMRLKVSDTINEDGTTNATWNDTGLQWDGSYSNERIVLYDYQYASTPDNNKVIAQPLYQADNNYNAFPNIFTIYDQSTSLRYLDGTKPAYAYETKTKNNIYDFPISGVADTYVKDANSDLNTYFTNTMFASNFTQYQTGSTYTITKKTGADDVLENEKGNIPATLVVDKGYDNSSFAPVAKSIDIVLTGFKEAPKATDIKAPDANASINLPEVYPYQIQGNQATTQVIKDFILNNILTGKVDGITGDNILSYSINSYDNKTGKLILNSITLNKWYDENGNVQDSTNKTFALANNVKIEISGFKEVSAPTSLKAQTISVDGELAALTTTQILLPSNKNILSDWLKTKKDSLLTNLPDECTITDLSIESATSSNGQIIISITIDGYYDSNALYSYISLPKLFNDITLTNFISQNLATTITQPTNDVDGQLASTLPQSARNNIDFKQYLLDNVVVDPTKQLGIDDITDFNGTYDNTAGTYILTSITLARRYDNDGNLLAAHEFSGLNYLIHGFKSIVTTATITAPLIIPEFATTSIIDATNKMIEDWLKKDANANQAFVTNSLPDDFSASNIVSVEIVKKVPSTGILNVNLVINNYYEGTIGTLTTTNSTPFELTISGFKTDSLATSVNVDPTAIVAYPNASNILAESITFASTGFKDYLFNHVLINPSKTLTIDNLLNIENLTANNIAGTLTFQLQVNKRADVDGNVIDGDFIFTNTITIKGFKKITATVINSSPLNLGDKNILADAVTPDQLLMTVKGNFLKIFKSLPNRFGSSNIVSVNKLNANKIKGEINVEIIINLYYAIDTGLTTTTPSNPFNLIISGYKSSLISFENRYDITNSFIEFASQIAGKVLADAPTTDVALMTSWLRTPKVFEEIIPDPKGSTINDFSVSTINKIDNNLGEIVVTIAVSGGTFVTGEDQLTFYGFRAVENIDAWINNIENTPISGPATSTSDQIKDIRDQIIKLSQSANSPFDYPLTANEIKVVANDNGKYNITIVQTTGYVNDKGIYVAHSTTPIIITAVYKINTPTNSQSGLESWVYPVIFSVVGVIAFLILLWIIMAIVKRKRNNKNGSDDYGLYM